MIFFYINIRIIGYWLDMEIYVRVLVRSNIARRQERNINYAQERVHIFPYPTNNLFITYALLSQKALGHLLCNFHQQNLKNKICIKQTKIEIQNESKTTVATSVSKAKYECVFKGISFITFRAPAYFLLYYLYFNRGFDIKCST